MQAFEEAISDVPGQLLRIPPQASQEGVRSGRRVVTIALALGIASGLFAWTLGEREKHIFRPRLYPEPRWEATWMVPTGESVYLAESKNAAFVNAIMGCSLGFMIGLAGGLASGSPGRGVYVGLCAQAAGLLAGGVAALAVIRLVDPVSPPPLRAVTDDVWYPLLIHAGSWGPIGIVGGAAFAFGFGARSRLKSIVASATAGAGGGRVLPDDRDLSATRRWCHTSAGACRSCASSQ